MSPSPEAEKRGPEQPEAQVEAPESVEFSQEELNDFAEKMFDSVENNTTEVHQISNQTIDQFEAGGLSTEEITQLDNIDRQVKQAKKDFKDSVYTPSFMVIKEQPKESKFDQELTTKSSPEDRETTAEKVEAAKKEIFEKAGERTPDEVKQLLGEVSDILRKEKEQGAGKLADNIGAIENGPHGKEYFVDNGVAYLPREGDAVFVGDTHGDAGATISILEQSRFIENMEAGDKDRKLVFTGDYADRGDEQLKNLEIIMNLKTKYPDNVILLRGNHEEESIGLRYGLLKDLGKKHDKDGFDLFKQYNDTFKELPGILVTANGVAAVHGGIPSRDVSSLKELQDPDVQAEMRWNDPTDKTDDRGDLGNRSTPNSRKFGKGAFNKFLETTGSKVMVRSHEVVINGAEKAFDDKLMTVFSNGSEKSTASGYSSVETAKIATVSLESPIENWQDDNTMDVDYILPDFMQSEEPEASEVKEKPPVKAEEEKAASTPTGGIDWGGF